MTDATERTLELLVDRVTEGLDPEHEAELAELLAGQPDLDPESFELAAAAIELSAIKTSASEISPSEISPSEIKAQGADERESGSRTGGFLEPMPDELRNRLSEQAATFFEHAGEASATGHSASSSTAAESSATEKVVPFAPRSEPSPHGPTNQWVGWLAAAAVLIAIAGWWPKSDAPTPPQGIETPSPLSPAQAKATLVAEAPDLLRLPWTATEDPAASGASGEVVWSTARQAGYMTFRGLPANDPAVEQYQLWIFDAEQDERYPVDGGVFDIRPSDLAGDETVIEIDAKLRITGPTLFAITVEKPGGVVVSSRERLPLLAQVG